MAIRKVSDLSGVALDWAVAKCEEYRLDLVPDNSYRPSNDWAQGGPIIERNHFTLRNTFDGGKPRIGTADAWKCQLDFKDGKLSFGAFCEYGPTPLIAAMRCYVAIKLGDEVDVPEGFK